MDGHDSPQDGDILHRVLPMIQEVERTAGILVSGEYPHWRRRSAAYDLLHVLKDVGEMGRDWSPLLRNVSPSRPIPTLDDEELWFLFQLGDRMHAGLLQHGLVWPPPLRRPPPALTRDLINLWRSSAMNRSQVSFPGQELTAAFGAISDKSEVLLESLLKSGDESSTRRPIRVATRIAREQQQAGVRGPIATLLAGMALTIGLLQGPGALHNFPRDVRELGGDITEVARIVTDGTTRLAEELARSMQ